MKIIITAGACAIAVAVGILALATTPTGTSAAATVGANDLVPQFAHQQTASDRLSNDRIDINPATTRLLGEDVNGQYWVAQNFSDEICLITTLNGVGEVSGVSCTTNLNFYHHGIFLAVQGAQGTSQRAVTYLVPEV